MPIRAVKFSLSVKVAKVIAIACDKKKQLCYYTSTINKQDCVKRLRIKLYKAVYHFSVFTLISATERIYKNKSKTYHDIINNGRMKIMHGIYITISTLV